MVQSVKPWESPNARELDTINVSTWIKQQPFAQPVNGYAYDHVELRGILASEPSDVSMLYWLSTIAKGTDGRTSGANQINGRLAHLSDTVEGAQQDKLPGSAWNISQQVYLQYLKDNVEFRSPVTHISQLQFSGFLEVKTPRKTYIAKQIVIAIPPVVCEKILFTPPLPAPRAHLQQRMFMGSVIKILLFYRSPFWKYKSLSGICCSISL
jgi:monoamine oxidase